MALTKLLIPIFAAIFTGWIFKALKVFREETLDHLVMFIIQIAAPSLLFISLAKMPFSEIAHPLYIIIYGSVMFGLFFLLFFVFKVKGKKLYESVLFAVSCTLVNGAFIGIPIIHALYGHKGMPPTAISIILVLTLHAVSLFFLEWGVHKKKRIQKALKKSIKLIITYPFTLALIAGVLCSFFEVQFPKGIDNYFEILGMSVVGVSLFTLGIRISFKKTGLHYDDTYLFTIIKLFIFPGIVFFLVWITDMNHSWAIPAVVMAALPTGKTCKILATEFCSSEDPIRHLIDEAITATTLFSLLTLIFWLYILTSIFPGTFQ